MAKVELDSWLGIKYISNLKSSPDKTSWAYAVHRTNLEKDTYEANLWVQNNDKHFQLTATNQESSFIWLNDDEILFSSSRTNQPDRLPGTDYYRISIHGGEAKKAFTLPLTVTRIEVLDDRRYLLSGIRDDRFPDFYKESEEERKKIFEAQKKETFFTHIDEAPFYTNGADYTAHQFVSMFVYDAKEDELKVLTDESISINAFEFDQSKRGCYCITSERKALMPLDSGVSYLDFEEGQCREILPAEYRFYGLKFIKDQLILWGHRHEQYGLNQNPRFFLLEEEQAVDIHEPFYSLGNSIGSDIRLGASAMTQVIQDELWFTMTVEDHSRLMRMKADGTTEIVYDAPGSIDGFTETADGLLMIALLKQDAQEIYRLKDGQVTALTSFNEEFRQCVKAVPQKLSVQKDKHSVDGWVLLPEGYDASKRYPAILDIHGGPKTVYGEVYYHEMQAWVSKGYVVLFCNPRGSDGKGNDFADIRGKYGTIDYEDIMDFVDAAEKQYSIDSERIGVTGGSYGGFMTNWIIGHTNRFKCAVTQRSISNWLSFYGTSDIGFYFAKDQNAAGIRDEQDVEKLWWHSPLKYADQMKTPTLIIHSAKDYRCPLEQAYQLLTALKENETDSELLIFHQENHDLSRSGKPQARMKRLNAITAWFEKYL